MSTVRKRDWLAWHAQYEDGDSDLSRRLAVVQDEIRKALPTDPIEEFRVISICAGQAHDLIGVLSEYPHADKVRARLVELNPDNVKIMNTRAHDVGLNLEIVEGDAADTVMYHGVVPANLVLAVGIFGNVSDDDVYSTIRALPQFCASGATLLWSRGRREPDITENIQATFREAGFVQTAFHAPEDARFRIGAVRYEGPPQQLQRAHLFSFVK